MNRGSVLGGTGDARSRSHLQDPRMRQDAADGYVLRRRSGKGDGAGQQFVSGGKDRQTKRG